MTQDPIQQMLRELAADQASNQPSEAVEAAVLGDFRAQRRRRRIRTAVASMAAAAALSLAIWLGMDRDAPAPQQAATDGAPVRVVTEFVPLDFGLTDPGEVTAGRLTRVTLPPTAPRDLGFPIPPHALPGGVQADLLLSEDGTPQAVRFVLPNR